MQHDASDFRLVKSIAIKAMFSDDYLMERLVLKGGNAIDIIYDIAERSSIDLDFSMNLDFKVDELPLIEARIERVLEETFREHGLEAFDIVFMQRPKRTAADSKEFWGGYRVEFKLIELKRRSEFGSNQSQLRRNALVIGPRQLKTFAIDISKFEYCSGKRAEEIDGLTVYVYTPEMIVFEKVRAICQQSEKYKAIVKTNTGTPRARDFFDIYSVMRRFPINFSSADSQSLVRAIFDAKHVPPSLIGEMDKSREFHRQDFVAVKDTLKPNLELKTFDFYFDYVVAQCKQLEPLWIV